MKEPNFWYRTKSFWAYLLFPFSIIYGWGVFLKRKKTIPYKSNVPIICVGNLTLGGTGKTPIALSLAEYFMSMGKKVGFLSRGYKGSLKGPIQIKRNFHTALKVGDEPLLLAQAAPTWIAKDKAAGVRMMEKKGVDLIIMDDGHQNNTVKKTISLVVIDGKKGIGNGLIFPAGPLRENILNGCKNADAFIIVGRAQPALKDFLEPFKKPCFQVLMEPSINIPQDIKNYTFFAFAGIGQPEKFFDLLRKSGLKVIRTKSFSDHHLYTKKDWDKLIFDAKCLRAQLITTEKDFVRLNKMQQKFVLSFPIHVKWKYLERVAQFFSDSL